MAQAKNLRILLLMDLSCPSSQDPEKFSELLRTEEFENEGAVYKSLQRLGHDVRPFGVFDNLDQLLEQMEAYGPDLVFNQCEAYRDDRQFEPNLIALLELLDIKYTGASSVALSLCKDKGLSKKILTYHQIRVPVFKVFPLKQPLGDLKGLTYPALVKPLGLEASEGIAKTSFVQNESSCRERVRFLHESLGVDVIVEEFIEGREVYASLLGNERVDLFPLRELFFKEKAEGEPVFATYHAKWDKNYRKRWGVRTEFARHLSAEVEKKVDHLCKTVYEQFHITGYARIDLRIREDGEVFFIEANPNPSLAATEDFALSAKQAGLPYDHLIEKIVDLAF